MAKGKINLPHTCPQCGKVAKNGVSALVKFGFRTMKQSNGSKVIRIQSWCRKCR